MFLVVGGRGGGCWGPGGGLGSGLGGLEHVHLLLQGGHLLPVLLHLGFKHFTLGVYNTVQNLGFIFSLTVKNVITLLINI